MSIERMAKAMHGREPRGPFWEPWEVVGESVREEWRVCARAALGALQGEGVELEAVAKAMAESRDNDWETMHESQTYPTYIGKASYRRLAEAAAPLLRAPLVAEVERLKAENELLRVALGAANDDTEAAHTVLARVTGELREALERYGEHAPSCTFGYSQSRVCTCGLNAALLKENET